MMAVVSRFLLFLFVWSPFKGLLCLEDGGERFWRDEHGRGDDDWGGQREESEGPHSRVPDDVDLFALAIRHRWLCLVSPSSAFFFPHLFRRKEGTPNGDIRDFHSQIRQKRREQRKAS